jgi:hypothetical protein
MPKPLVSVKLPNEHEECQQRTIGRFTVHRFKYFNIDCVNYSNHRQITSQNKAASPWFLTERQFFNSKTELIATKMALLECFALARSARSMPAAVIREQNRRPIKSC